MTIPADNNCVPTLIWLVVMPKSVVMVDVSAPLILPRSTCREKKARPRMGRRMKSTLRTIYQ